jgi:hypothetical protein
VPVLTSHPRIPRVFRDGLEIQTSDIAQNRPLTPAEATKQTSSLETSRGTSSSFHCTSMQIKYRMSSVHTVRLSQSQPLLTRKLSFGGGGFRTGPALAMPPIGSYARQSSPPAICGFASPISLGAREVPCLRNSNSSNDDPSKGLEVTE